MKIYTPRELRGMADEARQRSIRKQGSGATFLAQVAEALDQCANRYEATINMTKAQKAAPLPEDGPKKAEEPKDDQTPTA